MREVEGESLLDAGLRYLVEVQNLEDAFDEVEDYEQLQQFVFDTDHAIGVHEIDKQSWKKYSGVEPWPFPKSESFNG